MANAGPLENMKYYTLYSYIYIYMLLISTAFLSKVESYLLQDFMVLYCADFMDLKTQIKAHSTMQIIYGLQDILAKIHLPYWQIDFPWATRQ